MTPGDFYIITSDFHKIDIGVIYLQDINDWRIFIPLLFENNHFDNTESCVLKGKIKTNKVGHGPNLILRTGLFVVEELKKTPSFLKDYCLLNEPFMQLNIDFEKIDLTGRSKDLTKIIVGGGTSFPAAKSLFDKYHIQSIVNGLDGITKSDLNLILKTT